MVKVREDMTGWKMWEHGVPDSRLTVIEQVEDYVGKNGRHEARYRCQCNCKDCNHVIVRGADLKNGNTKSCGCLSIDKLIARSKRTNKVDLSKEYGIIWTTNTNEEIYFDLEDLDKVLNHTWYKNVYGYPETHIGDQAITMHKLLGYYYPDHHNRNKLDNRKENLIVCTIQENNRNKSIRSDNTSGIIGVYMHKKNHKWVSYINPGNGAQYLGSFVNKKDAIASRLEAEAKYFGEFAPQRHLFEEYGIDIKEAAL